jgi:hypothetical protein
MYVLPQMKLAILDCCDSMDAASAVDVVPSSCLLEIFCYLISDHRLNHTKIDEVKRANWIFETHVHICSRYSTVPKNTSISTWHECECCMGLVRSWACKADCTAQWCCDMTI